MTIRATDRITVTFALQLAESAKLEQAIKANLPARRSAQREGGRGLGYGG